MKILIKVISNESLKNLLALTAAVALTSACTTTGGNSAEKNADLQVSAQKASGKPLLQRSGNKISEDDSGVKAERWLQLQKAKTAQPKIAGLLASGDWQNAAAEARIYLQGHPGDLWTLKILASALAVGSEYDLAAYYATQVEKQEPNDADAANIKALAMIMRPNPSYTDYLAAMELFNHAFQQNTNHVAAGLNLADLYLRLGNPVKAREVYRAVLDRKGQLVPARLGYAIASNRLKDYDSAVVSLKMVLQKNPKHPLALYQIALIYKNGYQDKAQAETHLNQLLAIESDSSRYIRERGQVLLRNIRGEATQKEMLELQKSNLPAAPAEKSAPQMAKTKPETDAVSGSDLQPAAEADSAPVINDQAVVPVAEETAKPQAKQVNDVAGKSEQQNELNVLMMEEQDAAVPEKGADAATTVGDDQ